MEEDFLKIRKVLDQRRFIADVNENLGYKLTDHIWIYTKIGLVGSIALPLSNVFLKTKFQRSQKMFDFIFWSGIITHGWLQTMLCANSFHYQYCVVKRDELDKISANNVKKYADDMAYYELSSAEKYLRKLYSKYTFTSKTDNEYQRMWAKQQCKKFN
jgi:hypothetical protein